VETATHLRGTTDAPEARVSGGGPTGAIG